MNVDLFRFVNDIAGQYSWLDSTAVFFADVAQYLFVLALIVMWFGGQRSKATVLYAGITAALAMCVNQIIGIFYQHPRPFAVYHVHQLIPHAVNNSFPSDHATAAFALAIAIWMRNRKMGAPLIVVAALISVSRVFAGVHFPADIVGGLLVAWASAWVIGRFSDRLQPLVQFIVNRYERTLNGVLGRQQ